MEYLHDEHYYTDRYDVQTIEECLYYYSNLKNGLIEKRSELKNLPDDVFDKDTQKCVSYAVNAISGERFRRKSETTRKWTERASYH